MILPLFAVFSCSTCGGSGSRFITAMRRSPPAAMGVLGPGMCIRDRRSRAGLVPQTVGVRYVLKPFAESFYLSKAWKETRKAYAKSRGNLCERCLAKGLYVPGEIVHHRVHLTPENISDPGVSLSWDNLELLCRDCHGEEHRSVPRRYKVDDLGRVTAK